ncbi:helix-hairpin-helix domain-containing protein [Pseudarthrobacter enclensis]|uniref:Competence protein ComEA n=1 Tax=Pseudarthrobacter enclensis TaxID=993070 RepID=A0ABT9RZH1_9MICC|nr:helix-hairpin-helix domain-containing protein [Pseudarthrobacter enclensis]MDP9890655.1 competence protein ComEA [Pseudarthrobacter enclensis]
MSRRDTAAAGQRARHARERLQAALGDSPPGLLQNGSDPGGFEYRGPDEAVADETGAGSGAVAGGLSSVRWRIGQRVAVLLAGLGVVAGAWFWWQAGTATPEVVPLSGVGSAGAPAATGTASGGAAGTAGDAGRQAGPAAEPIVVVHVAGAVAQPGVIRLPQGSRVGDAIAAAGGATGDADANRLNLALVVEDGQKVYVPQRGESVAAEPGASDAGGAGTGGKINLNTADAAELDTLPKVGPILAQRIVDWRKEHGPFKTVDELDAVDGVGPKMLEALLPLVTV